MHSVRLRFFFALFSLFSPHAGAGVVIDRLEASVNSSIILHSDLAKFRKLLPLRAQLDPFFPGTPLAQKGAAAGNSEISRFLVEEKIMAQAFPVADQEVEQEIQSIQTSNRIARKELRSALAAQGFAFEDYFELIRISLVKRNLIDREIRPKVVITDDEVKARWLAEGGRARASGPRQYTFRMIRVDPSLYKTRAFAKSAAEEARRRVHGGESIHDVARSISLSSEEGALEFKDLAEGEISPQLRREIRKLPVNGVSPVVSDGRAGFYVVQLISSSSATDDAFERVKEDIRTRLLTAEFRNQIRAWIDQKSKTAFVHYAK